MTGETPNLAEALRASLVAARDGKRAGDVQAVPPRVCGKPTAAGPCPETNHCGEMVFPHHPEWGPILCTRPREHAGTHSRTHFTRFGDPGGRQ